MVIGGGIFGTIILLMILYVVVKSAVKAGMTEWSKENRAMMMDVKYQTKDAIKEYFDENK